MLAQRRTYPVLSPRRLPSLHVMMLAVWVGAIMFGMVRLGKYERTPALVRSIAKDWPLSSRLPTPSNGYTLVMAAHPACPCTRAGLHALARIMASTPHPQATYVLFYRPRTLPAGWKQTDLHAYAATIPGVALIEDEEGREAARFHLTVSGQTLLFDAMGRLRYSGGITSGRGVEGDSSGLEAIRDLVQGRETQRTQAPVFGCSLLSSK